MIRKPVLNLRGRMSIAHPCLLQMLPPELPFTKEMEQHLGRHIHSQKVELLYRRYRLIRPRPENVM